ncbi:MAG: menaquinone biosynthesis protein [Ferruginibacter sp.]
MCAVNYLNTKPLVYGFEKGLMAADVDLQFTYPADLATNLKEDKVDVGLIPVAALQELPEHFIISDYGIAADGDVASVCLFSEVPLEGIKTIYLDYQSRSSVMLLKILLHDFYCISPELVSAESGYEQKIKGTTAGLVIGDRALSLRHRFSHIYDLAGGWKKLTGLPMVFAIWAANKKLPVDFKNKFNSTTGEGLQHLEEIAASIDYKPYNLTEYFTKNIRYILDDAAMEGMRLFEEKVRGMGGE